MTEPSAGLTVPPPAPMSYLNFESVTTSDTSKWGRTGNGNAFESFMGSWYTNTGSNKLSPIDTIPGDGIDQTLIAMMYVSTGADVIYSGQMGFSTNHVLSGSFSTQQVPEPCTIALLATGLMGLLCCVWRKRK